MAKSTESEIIFRKIIFCVSKTYFFMFHGKKCRLETEIAANTILSENHLLISYSRASIRYLTDALVQTSFKRLRTRLTPLRGRHLVDTNEWSTLDLPSEFPHTCCRL